MTSKTPISLINFFIFNPLLPANEGEEYKKILYYFPEDQDINIRERDVGLCEAVIKFTETFSTTPCESFHTQKTRQVFLQPEDDFWMVMTLTVPSQQKTKDGEVHIEYNSDEIQDHVYQSVLLTSYRLFTLVKGTFRNILERSNSDIEVLKQNVEEFFSAHLPTLKVNDSDLLDVFQGIHFLPLERYAFLKIQSFINEIEEKFSNIKYVIFVYNNQLVWSGLNQEDMQIMFHHLAVSIIPSYVESELKGGTMTPSRISPFGSGSHFGRFMTGPKTLDDETGMQNIPKIYLNSGKSAYYLVIYRALNATLCMLIEEKECIQLEFFKSLDAEIGTQLTALASEIGEQYSKTPSTSSDSQSRYLYLYFNHMNLAEKTTVHSGMNRMGAAILPQDIMKLLADLNNDIYKGSSDNLEVIGKTVSDCWVVGKLSDQREFYLVLQQKNANIVDVSEEMKKLNMTHFQNIFVLD